MPRETPSDVTPAGRHGREISQAIREMWERNYLLDREKRVIREYIQDLAAGNPPRHSRQDVWNTIRSYYSGHSDRYRIPDQWADITLNSIDNHVQDFPRAAADLANEKFYFNNDYMRYRGMPEGAEKIHMRQSLDNWQRAIENEQRRLQGINVDVLGGAEDHLLRMTARPNGTPPRWNENAPLPHEPSARNSDMVSSVVENVAQTVARRTVKFVIVNGAPIVGSGIATYGIFNAQQAQAHMNSNTDAALAQATRQYHLQPNSPAFHNLQQLNRQLHALSNQIANVSSLSEIVGGVPWAEIGALAGGVVGFFGGAGVGAAPGAAGGAAALSGSALVVCSTLDLWAESQRQLWEQMRQHYEQALEQVARQQIAERTQRQIQETRQEAERALRAQGIPEAEIRQRLGAINWADVVHRANGNLRPEEELQQQMQRVEDGSPEFQRARQRLDNLDGVLDSIETDPRIRQLREQRRRTPMSMNEPAADQRYAAADVTTHDGQPTDLPLGTRQPAGRDAALLT